MKSKQECPKQRYRDKDEALHAARLRMKSTSQNAPLFLRAYPCHRCKGWHLTSERMPGAPRHRHILILNAENGAWQIRMGLDTELRKVRMEIYARNNAFVCGRIMTRDELEAWFATIDWMKARAEGGRPPVEFPDLHMPLESPEVYGEPQLADAKSKANA